MRLRLLASISVSWAFLSLLNVSANGLLIPKRDNLPPLAIKDQTVKIRVTNNLSHTHVTQIFKNHTHQQLEAVFVFPLPKGAVIDEFAMMMNGKRVKGEVLEKSKARQIYTDIVRRMRDPGLIEFMDHNLFKASIFPVPARGEQKIEISFAQALKPEAGLAEYLYPLKTSYQALRVLGNFSLYCELDSKVPLKNIYSPTHRIDVVRKSDYKAKISFEERGTRLDRDFQLFYSVSPKKIGLNLVSHRADRAKDGYFMMMIAPQFDMPAGEIPAKDVSFVIDCSGSMNGEKMTQARKALEYCVNQLRAEDRFNVVRFSTDVDTFADKLSYADEKQKIAARKYIQGLQARGGTDINSALQKALSMKEGNKRPYLVVFITDGHPTIGTIDKKDIIKNFKAKNSAGTRVFVFGVGNELNTLLLDQLAEESQATSQYVRSGENIEVKVSSFFDKVSSPVFTNINLKVANAKIYDFYPRKVGDLFHGQQIMLFGRYRNPGHHAVTLTGTIAGKQKSFVFETSFPDHQGDNIFVSNLWAHRKVGFLLSEIRQNGEKKELKDEVVRLAKEFGIVTPYTSYLAVEDTIPPPRPRPRPWPRPPHPPHPPIPLPRPIPMLRESLQKLDVKGADDAAAPAAADFGEIDKEESRRVAKKARDVSEGMRSVGGKNAVVASQVLESLKDSSVQPSQLGVRKSVVRVGAHSYFYYQGIWIDQNWVKDRVKPTRIKYLSKAWFKLAENANLRKALGLGPNVIIQLDNGKAILIDKEGTEELSDEEMKKLLK